MAKKSKLPNDVDKVIDDSNDDELSIVLRIEDNGDMGAYIALPKQICKQKMLVISGDSLDKFIKGLDDGVAKLKEAHNIS